KSAVRCDIVPSVGSVTDAAWAKPIGAMATKLWRSLAFIGFSTLIAAVATACDNSRGDGPGSTGRVLGNFREIRERIEACPRTDNSGLACFASTREPGSFGTMAAR